MKVQRLDRFGRVINDDGGILRDGERLRIPMTMQDSAMQSALHDKRAPDLRQQVADGELVVCDVYGRTGALLRGSRFLRRRDGSDSKRFEVADAEYNAGAAAAARMQMIEDSCNAWRKEATPAPLPQTSAEDAYKQMVLDSENAWKRRPT
jgi:hypothetical protein